MNNPVVAYLVVFGGMPTAGIIAGWMGRGIWERCRPNRTPPPPAPTALDLDPVEALMATVTCTWCKPRPAGLCSCSGPCGHLRCVGRTPRWTAAEREFLIGRKEMPR